MQKKLADLRVIQFGSLCSSCVFPGVFIVTDSLALLTLLCQNVPRSRWLACACPYLIILFKPLSLVFQERKAGNMLLGTSVAHVSSETHPLLRGNGGVNFDRF